MNRDEAKAFMGDEIYDEALLEQGFQQGFKSATDGLILEIQTLQAANTRRVMREGIVNAQLKQIAQAVIELSQFNVDSRLTLGSQDNMQSIITIYSSQGE